MRGGREVAISAVFTALLVASILFLPSLLLTSGRLGPSSTNDWPFLAKNGGGYPVSFAYLISATTGDAERAARLLAALYHPANSYLLHLDREAPAEEHRRLADLVSGQAVYGRVGNVWIVGKPNPVTYRGPTMLSTTLHAMAALLRVGRRWDWFVNLSASDYPLVTPDGQYPFPLPGHTNSISITILSLDLVCVDDLICRFDGCLLAAAQGSQLHTAHQPPGMEDVRTNQPVSTMHCN